MSPNTYIFWIMISVPTDAVTLRYLFLGINEAKAAEDVHQ